MVSFKGRFAVTSLQHTFLGHYLTVATAPPATTDIATFKLARPPPSAPRLTLERLQRGAVNTDSRSDNDANYAADL